MSHRVHALRLAPFLLVLTGCAASEPDPGPKTWGTLREVLRDGQTQGRVALAEAGSSPHAVGVGALEGLAGEILVYEGQVWLAEAAGGRIEARLGARAGDRAAFLVLDEVEEWRELRTSTALDAEGLEVLLTGLREENRITAPAFAFVVDGELGDLEAHVLAGRCPYGPPPADGSGEDPVRFSRERATGRLVGFYSDLPPGTITHHGSKLHVHVLLAGEEPLVGHVDSVLLGLGATVRVPDR